MKRQLVHWFSCMIQRGRKCVGDGMRAPFTDITGSKYRKID